MIPRVGFISDSRTPYRDPLLGRISRRPEFEFEVTFCSERTAGLDWQLEDPGFEMRTLPTRGFVTRGETVLTHLVQPEIVGHVRRGNYDLLIVSSYSQPTSLFAVATARTLGIPYMILSESHALRSRSQYRGLVRNPIVRWVLRGAAGGFAVGTLARQYLIQFGVPEDRVFFFPNTPDTAAFRRKASDWRPRRAETRAALGADEAAPVAIYVGRLLRIKGVDTLLEAWKRVREEQPCAELWIVGDGPEGRALRRAAGAGVRFLGFRQQDELPSLYAASDLFVLPSRSEPYGVVVNEAAASGLPVIASDQVGAARDLVVEGETGSMFTAGDHSQLAAAILVIFAREDRGRGLGEQASALAERWGYDFAESEFVRGVSTVLGVA